MLTTEAVLRSISSRLEEAGRLIASSLRVWGGILFPLIGPAWAVALLVVFVLAISDFAVPSMLRVRVYTTEVFTAFASLYEFRLATVMAMPLAALAALAAVSSLEFARRPFVVRAERVQAGVRWTDGHQRVAAVVLGVIHPRCSQGCHHQKTEHAQYISHLNALAGPSVQDPDRAGQLPTLAKKLIKEA